MKKNRLLEIIDDILPQTQCGKCGYKSCKPYAEDLLKGIAEINLCSPGGDEVILKLAKILKKEVIPLDTTKKKHDGYKLAMIKEDECIGCTICIQKCPVDAIIGAPKKMHTVLNQWCTGCELCITPCPVDCIEMISTKRNWTKEDSNNARQRYIMRQERIKPKSSTDINLTEVINYNNKALNENIHNIQKEDFIRNITSKAKEKRKNNTIL
ncbi:electron transport complex protein RnfB [Candidatus Kinetoplastibacterium desouzaii TCC079E]|uniref:Electron transport complex protein RnfB n=1 Tax=Candidatus Kinetoplastidibacterium desouzai TCC079E TaxID=1208919 RepID=M1LMS5_9PROT|nr:RnfABCDGE type electron transport complex subunit B [Candidatus Kinetoplastibacterium desouzaii]AGF47027.1 electron transport complex protein RnfB [Candidatus Kinetoplastibacterium desouzaii TCC079E]